jgi:hypothetical protein
LILTAAAACTYLPSPATPVAPAGEEAPAGPVVADTAAAAQATARPRVWVQVDNTGGSGVLVRVKPGSDLIVGGWLDGTYLEVTGDDVTAGGQLWRYVRGPDGSTGWVPAQYVARARNTPTPGPTDTPVPPPTATPTETPTPGPTATPTSTPLPLDQLGLPPLTTTPTVFTAASAIERQLSTSGYTFQVVIGREGNGVLTLFARPDTEQAAAWRARMGGAEKRALLETIARLLREAFPEGPFEAHVLLDGAQAASARTNARGGIDVVVLR